MITFPRSEFVGHAHWDRVEWVPFKDRVRLIDACLNVLLYVPGGLLAVRTLQWRLGPILGAGFVLSVSAEALQVWSHGRMPTAADILTNLSGLALGAFLARRLRR